MPIGGNTTGPMDYQRLTSLLIKLVGLFTLVNGLIAAPTYIFNSISAGQADSPLWVVSLASVLPIGLTLLLGLGLLYFPQTISNRLVYDGGELSSIHEAATTIKAIAISILGLYLLVHAVSDAVYHVARLFLYQRMIHADPVYRGMPAVLPKDFGYLAATAAEFLMALWLLRKGRSIAGDNRPPISNGSHN